MSFIFEGGKFKIRIAFLGIGLLGRPMAERLLRFVPDLIVYNRTQSRTLALKNKGALVAHTPAEAVQTADCVLLMVSHAAAVQELLLSPEVTPLLSAKTIIQMSTIAPDESIKISAQVEQLGAHYLEAPVLGSIPEANSGKLIVMVGASKTQYDQWRELLAHFGPNPLYIGPVGQASALKLALNQLIASMTAAFSFSLGLVRQAGIDIDQFMAILRDSALYAPTFDKKLQRMVERNFENPNFPVKHLLKDVDLMLTTAQKAGLATDNLAGLRNLICQALENGLGELDYSAIYQVIHPAGPK